LTTLITGATGFVGSAVLRQLIEAGHKVRALVRPGSERRNLKGLEVETVSGELRDPASLARAVKGCNALFHIAADYRLWVPRPEEIYRTNVEGTRNLMRAAQQAGVERVVYTSSVATLGLKADRTPADETTLVTLKDMIGHYKRSKYLAEEVVRKLAQEEGLPAVIVNPTAPVGPRDIKPTPTGRMVLDAAAGRIPAYVETGLNVVHVDDVAAGHLLALERGTVGERYVLGGTNMAFKEILSDIAMIAGKTPPRIRLPHRLVLPLAYLAQGFARITGKEPLMTVDGVRLAKKWMFFSTEKAIREFGYQPRPARVAFEDAIQWFHDNSYF
jgi:hopanoid-associated sugar epimerase